MLAAATAQIEACHDAVHGNIATAEEVCEVPKGSIDVFSPDAMSSACQDAMKAGQRAGRLANHPIQTVRGKLIKDFDEKYALCINPPAKEQVKERETVNLWD